MRITISKIEEVLSLENNYGTKALIAPFLASDLPRRQQSAPASPPFQRSVKALLPLSGDSSRREPRLVLGR